LDLHWGSVLVSIFESYTPSDFSSTNLVVSAMIPVSFEPLSLPEFGDFIGFPSPCQAVVSTFLDTSLGVVNDVYRFYGPFSSSFLKDGLNTAPFLASPEIPVFPLSCEGSPQDMEGFIATILESSNLSRWETYGPAGNLVSP
jgi:hypothetical protein